MPRAIVTLFIMLLIVHHGPAVQHMIPVREKDPESDHGYIDHHQVVAIHGFAINDSSNTDLWLTFTNTRRTANGAANTGVTNIKLMRPVSKVSAQSYDTKYEFSTSSSDDKKISKIL